MSAIPTDESPTVLLVGNYVPDQQESMLRFAAMMAAGLRKEGFRVVETAPIPLLGFPGSLAGGLWKWFAYVDKFVIFPWRLRSLALRLARRGNLLVHIADHSNAAYFHWLRRIPRARRVITCHDVLAISSARGDHAQNETAWTGRIFQRWIRSGLDLAGHVFCVSQGTARALVTLCPLRWDEISVVYNGFNADYGPTAPGNVAEVLGRLSLPDRYLLHVGGNAWYKNRIGILQAYVALCAFRPAPPLVMIGKPLDEATARWLKEQPVAARIHFVLSPSDADLRALYGGAEMLLFPSLAEGFGWPIIEALACGCRVVTSNRTPMREIGGGAPLYADPENPEDIARRVGELLDESPEERRRRIEAGMGHVRIFSTERMIGLYAAALRSLFRGGS